MSRMGRSARTRQQRLDRRRAESRGFDRGGGRRSIFRSRYAKIFYVVGLVGLMGSLLPLLLLDGDGGHGASSGGAGEAGTVAIRRPVGTDPDEIGAVEKPTYEAPPAQALDPELDYIAVFELESGTVRIQLFDDVAPVHANNFIFLIQEGFYDGLTFHRVVEGELAQTGDPSATNDSDAGYILPDEAFGQLDEPLTLGDSGLIAMARTSAGASSSQFFITLSPQGQLNQLGFTPFGRVIDGLEVAAALTVRNPLAVPAPEAGDRILRASIETVPAGSQVVELPYVSAVAAAAGEAAAADQAGDDDGDPAPPGPPDGGAVDKPSWDQAPAFRLDPELDYVAVLELDSGTVRIDLFEDIAPIHTNNFVFLSEEGFYDGLTFHRVIEGFVAQGGDPTATGTGGSGYRLPDEDRGDNAEALGLNAAGVISMARNQLGASGSQFFITYAAQAHLNADFTAFGRVIEGMDAVDALPRREPTFGAPAGGRIISITIETTAKS